ncbi:DUF4232 domain-containing protein [Nocardioides kongjuensis]|uniref:DUF4232 domain-containing protein n=1 Tax=Nocardioides kongjuensis TaxID=349522 RepID=A0A852RW80_9ACTN|nr:hypothetical protein [Nocardioides kongjuensis]
MKRLLGSVLLLLALSGCSGEAEPGARTPTGEPDGTTAPPGLDEVSPGFDESPDGEPPVPDDQLEDAALTALLRTRATAYGGDHCAAEQVEVSLEGYDQAAGHRYSRVVVRNTGDDACVVEGVPGVGARGAWGTTFVNEIGPGTGDAPASPVLLSPGESAASGLEWTGDLAGAESEHVSLLVLQLARGQVPLAVPARIGVETLDIGPFTTIRLAPFVRTS